LRALTPTVISGHASALGFPHRNSYRRPHRCEFDRFPRDSRCITDASPAAPQIRVQLAAGNTTSADWRSKAPQTTCKARVLSQ
jgi:hypothetical protein